MGSEQWGDPCWVGRDSVDFESTEGMSSESGMASPPEPSSLTAPGKRVGNKSQSQTEDPSRPTPHKSVRVPKPGLLLMKNTIRETGCSSQGAMQRQQGQARVGMVA